MPITHVRIICQDACRNTAARDLGGINVYDASAYKMSMKRVERFECLIPYNSVELFSFTHKNLPPTVGAACILCC